MRRVETQEFSVEANPMFETVRIFGGSIGLKRDPETFFSPQMSVWTTEPETGRSPQDWLMDFAKEAGPVVERKAITASGLAGEMTKIKDRLKDFETRKSKDWYRFRALLVPADNSVWYHATAMASGDELAAIEQDFVRLLGSIEVKLSGDSAQTARVASEAEVDALVEELKARSEHEPRRSLRATTVTKVPRSKVTAAAVEKRFDKVIASLGLKSRRDALRAIAMPTLVMTEAGEASANRVGLSRVGGGPDLPEGMEWPRDESGFHLNFLAQIDLADLPARYETLPEGGLLSVFSGTDYTDWRMLYTPAGARLTAHGLPEDAESTASAAMRMVVWDSDRGRFVADGSSVDGLAVETDANGRLTFTRDGAPVLALASEYEISRSQQVLRFEPSLTVPFGLPGACPPAYVDAGLEDPSDFWPAIQDAFALGEGPQHQMFGLTGVRDLTALQQLAAGHAEKQGWTDIAAPSGWLILLKLASGGEADFSFSDHGDYVFMAHRADTARGDFSRIYAFVEAG